MMTRRFALAAIVALTWLGTARPSQAHDGHVHTVRGVITQVAENQFEIKGEDGKTISVTMNAKTSVLQGTRKAERAAMQIGQRVVVDVGNGKTPLVARSVKLGVVGAKK